MSSASSSPRTKPREADTPPGDLVAHCPIVVGNVCQWTGKPSPGRHMIQDESIWWEWTAYVRGLDFEDLSYFIDKVVFHLHHTFENPIRGMPRQPSSMHIV